MNELIDNLMASMKDRIEGLKWMSPETKKQAATKLSTFKRKIGYPDKLRGYKGLTIDRKSFAGNTLRSAAFQIKRNFEENGARNIRLGNAEGRVDVLLNTIG